MTSASAAGSSGRIPLPTVLAFSATGIPTAAIVVMMTVYMPRYFASHMAVPLVAVAAAFTFVRLLDIVFDPIIGVVMDKTRSPIGRYRLWMIISAPVLMVAVYMLFNPPEGAGRNYLILWLLPYYAGISMFVLSHTAWASALARSYNDRSRVFGWMQAVSVIGSVGLTLLPLITLGAITPGTSESMGPIGWMIIALLPTTVALVAFFTPERVSVDVQRERFGLKDYLDIVRRPEVVRLVAADLFAALSVGVTSPIFIFFFTDAKGFTVAQSSLLLAPYLAAGLFGAPFWGWVAQKIGKHRSIQAATVAFMISQATLMALPKGTLVLTGLGMAAVGFCAVAFIVMIRAMVADVADVVRLEQGRERAGLLFALITSTQKIGSALSVIVIYPILALVGYNAVEGAVNTPEAIFGLEMCYLFAPIALGVLAGAMFIGYRLDASHHADVRAALDARDAAASPESPTVETLTGSQTLPDVSVEPAPR